MWRISDDIWDLWHGTDRVPQGLGDQFSRAANWAPLAEPGHWPDADMLPLGHLGPAPGWGSARETRLTHDEQRTLVTLWCMLRSPLMLGGNLTLSDPWTASLLTNSEVIAVDQHSTESHQVLATEKTVVWRAQSASAGEFYLALFNTGESSETIGYGWNDLGLGGTNHQVRDLWEHKDLGREDSVAVTLPAHGSCALPHIAGGGHHGWSMTGRLLGSAWSFGQNGLVPARMDQRFLAPSEIEISALHIGTDQLHAEPVA